MAGDDTMQPAARPDTRLTYEDFLLFPDDGRRHELDLIKIYRRAGDGTSRAWPSSRPTPATR